MDYVGSVGIELLALIGVCLLFLLRKEAVWAFAASLALNVGYTVLHTLTTNWLAAAGGSGLLGMVVGWLTMGAVILYALRLRQRSLLK
jgi:hypothetical protein